MESFDSNQTKPRTSRSRLPKRRNDKKFNRLGAHKGAHEFDEEDEHLKQKTRRLDLARSLRKSNLEDSGVDLAASGFSTTEDSGMNLAAASKIGDTSNEDEVANANRLSAQAAPEGQETKAASSNGYARLPTERKKKIEMTIHDRVAATHRRNPMRNRELAPENNIASSIFVRVIVTSAVILSLVFVLFIYAKNKYAENAVQDFIEVIGSRQ